MSLQTEYEFNLPKGNIDEAGVIHKNGIMRVATVMDEIQASNHPESKSVSGIYTGDSLIQSSKKIGNINGGDSPNYRRTVFCRYELFAKHVPNHQ